MRRLLFAALAVAAITVIVGCGSSKQSAAQSPTQQALSYFPASTPFVLTVASDPKSEPIKQAHALMQRFPAAALLETAVFTQIARQGVDYNKDIRPLFGNPLAVGAVGSQFSGSDTPFLMAWVTKSPSALQSLLKKAQPSLRSAGTRDGAKLYATAGAAAAVDGSTLLFGRSKADIVAALDRHSDSRGFSSAQYSKDVAGLSGNALIQMVGDLSGVLSTPQAARARRIPWVAAIRGYGVAIGADPNGFTVRYHVDTTGGQLTASQLPIAAGATPPGLAGAYPIQAGLRNLAQSIDFAETAAQAASPAQYEQFTKEAAKLKRKTGFDLDAFVPMLSGDLDVSSNTHATIGRVQVSDPSAVSSMVGELLRAPNEAFNPGTKITPLGGGLYRVKETDATLVMGVVGNQLLFGAASPAQVRAYANAPSSAAPGATGAASVKIALRDLLHLTIKTPPSGAAQQILNLLGDVTSSASATPAGLTGSAQLALK